VSGRRSFTLKCFRKFVCQYVSDLTNFGYRLMVSVYIVFFFNAKGDNLMFLQFKQITSISC